MYRTATLGFLTRRLTTKHFVSFASSDSVASTLPNPSIAMAPDTNHIVCYHPEKDHPYEFTKPIDRTDPSFAQNDSVFKFEVQQDYQNRYEKKEITKKDFRLDTDRLAQMFNEHPALFKPTPKRDKIRRAPQFAEPKPDRSGI